MDAFTLVEGVAAPLPAANVDTDVIMPKQFLKGVDRAGLDKGVFHDLRLDADSRPRPSFILNQAPWTAAAFLVVGPNFGCGSSREHAVWGLRQLGIRALIGTSYAGIFFDNCARNGLLAFSLEVEVIDRLLTLAADPGRCRFSIDLGAQTITAAQETVGFEIDSLRKTMLLKGLDSVGLTLEGADGIRAFEMEYLSRRPWLETAPVQ